MDINFLEAAATVGLVSSYFPVLSAANYFSKKGSEKIDGHNELVHIIGDESTRRGIEPPMILKESDEDTSYTEKINNGYEIYIHPDDMCRMSVRHEIGHIANGDCETIEYLGKIPIIGKPLARAVYFLFSEPRVAIQCIKSKREARF